MRKILFCILLSAAALMATGCAPVQMVPPETMGPDIYRISARTTSKKILSETVKSAKERCTQENKQYLFVKNIFQHSSSLGVDTGSYDLYFTCVEDGDPRLKERKILPRPTEEKVDKIEKKSLPTKDREQTFEDRPGPEKERQPAPVQSIPAKELIKTKSSVSSDKEAAPAQEKLLPQMDENQGQKDATTKGSEEQLRKKNPGMGEPESLRKDDSPLKSEDGQDSPIIEESLDGYSLDKENYLKRRFRKKK